MWQGRLRCSISRLSRCVRDSTAVHRLCLLITSPYSARRETFHSREDRSSRLRRRVILPIRGGRERWMEGKVPSLQTLSSWYNAPRTAFKFPEPNTLTDGLLFFFFFSPLRIIFILNGASIHAAFSLFSSCILLLSFFHNCIAEQVAIGCTVTVLASQT